MTQEVQSGRESAFSVPVDRTIPAYVSQGWDAVPAVLQCPVLCFFGRSRLVVECSGYTCIHLPVWNWKPDFPKKEDAMLAIFAARIALSSLEIRSWLK